MKFVHFSLSILLVSLLASCGGGGGGDGDSGAGLGGVSFKTERISTSTEADGIARFSFVVPEGSTAFQLAAVSEGSELVILTLTDPNGTSVFETPSERGDSTTYQDAVNVFNFPTITNGVVAGTYQVTYFLTQNDGRDNAAGVGVELAVTTKSDPNILSGTLPVNISYIGPVADATELVKDIEAAVEIWRGDFEEVGITLDVQYYSFDGPGLLPDPRRGDSFYTGVTQATRPGAVNLVIGRDVIGVSGNRDFNFSVPGGIPGAAIASSRSVGALSIEEVTGGDGLFDSDEDGSNQLGDSEVGLAAEELAQLAGHFLGLQHPVDFNGDNAEETDRISDTASCLGLDDCRAEPQPRENFMFSRILRIPDEGNTFYTRDDITPGQAALMHRNVMMR